ncbi:MAG TPA: Wzz/FepE/Etk N-terminal domain-containing protein [Anaerolineae bacterium]
MEDEIDLRAYLDVLLRRWKWIVGVTLVAALVAGVVSLLMPPTYESTASVFVQPQVLVLPYFHVASFQV